MINYVSLIRKRKKHIFDILNGIKNIIKGHINGTKGT